MPTLFERLFAARAAPDPARVLEPELARALDHAVASLTWAFALAVERSPGQIVLRGQQREHAFVIGLAHARVGVSIETEAIMPEGAWIHARQPLDDRLAGTIGHASFDAHYRVSPAEQGRRLAPELVELLARSPRPGLALTSGLLILESPRSVGELVRPSDPPSRDRFGVHEPALVVLVRESLALARSLDACGGRRWG